MTSQEKPNPLTFYRSGPLPCPYLPGRVEQQLFTDLSGPDARDRYDTLSQNGFRRSHHIAYRPSCRGCSACIPVRIVAPEFRTSPRWRRILRANADLRCQDKGIRTSDEQFDLFLRYMRSRHDGGDMARMTRHDYTEMVASSPIDTAVIEYRDGEGELIAACLTDRTVDGFSAVYSFFDPAHHKRSLGSYIILSLIDRARIERLPYVYLGYWIEASRKMSYKRHFAPIEGYGSGGWRPLAEFTAPAAEKCRTEIPEKVDPSAAAILRRKQ